MEIKIHLRENWLLRIWRAKKKYFQGAEEFSFRDLGRSMHYFQGSREHRPPWGASLASASAPFYSLIGKYHT